MFPFFSLPFKSFRPVNTIYICRINKLIIDKPMKKLILLIVFAALNGVAAWGQISFYGEWCRKGSGKLDSKVWHTPEYMRSESENNGEKTIMIFDMKEKKAYVMNEARKSCMVMNEIDKLSLNKLVGYDWEVARSTSQEFLGMENIEGKECAHYYVKSESTYKGGGKDAAGYHEWIYSPMKSSNYNGCIAHDNTAYSMDRTVVLRRIQQRPQPTHLFQVPEGYKMTVVPAGGLLEMLTGKSREENTKKVAETRETIQESSKQMMEQLKDVNDKSKSDEERMKTILNLLGGEKKK